MSRVVVTPAGRITVTPSALQQLVVRAAEREPTVRVRRPRRGLEVAVEGERVRVELGLAVRYGEVLPEAARAAQERVVEALAAMCDLEVEAVDVTVEELDE